MIKFGPSGNSKSFYAEGNKSTLDAPSWLAQKGLDAYEYSFGRGINIGDEKAQALAQKAAEHGIAISVHAPYYINFANPDEQKAENSYRYVLDSLAKAKVMGANRVVFHPATVGKMSRDAAVKLANERIRKLAELAAPHIGNDVWLCPETMGKINQIGDVAEVTEFCRAADFLLPTIDFGHINARTYGSLKTQEDFEAILAHVENALGHERASKMHMHFSKIEYSQGGEVRHLTFADSVFGPEFAPLAKAIKKFGLSPVIICESDGTQAEDALEMKRIYESL